MYVYLSVVVLRVSPCFDVFMQIIQHLDAINSKAACRLQSNTHQILFSAENTVQSVLVHSRLSL